jgi:hypothetical protein
MPESFTFEEAQSPALSPEDLLRVAADAKQQGYGSFTVDTKGGGKMAMTPTQAAGGVKTMEPPSFTFEEAQGPAKPAEKKSEEPGMLERMREQSLPAIAGRYLASSNLETEQLGKIGAKGPDGKSEFDRERERRIAAKEKSDPATMMKWATDLARERVHGKAAPDVPIGEQLKTIWKAASSDPIKFGRDLLESAAAHPEYWPAGPAAPLLAVAESAFEQASGGKVDWGQATLEGVLTAAPATVIHAATTLGHVRAAQTKGAKVTPEANVKAVEQVKEKIEQGMPPVQAADQVLAAMGVKPEERASIVKDAKEVIDHAERDESRPVLPEAQGKEGQVERGSDLPVVDRAKPEDRKAPDVEEEKVVKPQAFKPLPEPLKGRMVTPEETFTILKEAGIDEEAARDMAGKVPISVGALRQRLTKFMGGQKYADSVLADVLLGPNRELPKPAPPEPSKVDLEPLRSEIGWHEYGGRIIREQQSVDDVVRGLVGAQGEVVGRTKWIPRSDFWPNRPVKISERDAHTALDKAAKGESLTKTESRFVEYARSEMEKRTKERESERSEIDREAAEERAAIQQYGRIDPKLLAAMGAVGLGAAGAYALTEDKSKAIKVAMLIGATAAGIAAAGRVGRAVRSFFDRKMADKSLKPMGPFNEFLARPQMVEYATKHWERTTDALLTGLPDKNVSRIKVRDWLQGHRDMELHPQEKAYAEEIRKFLDTLGSMAHDAGTIDRLRENYLTGLYQKKPFKKWGDILRELTTDEAFRGNYTGMSRNSRFNLQKTIPDYRTAERLHAEGKFPLIPLTNDPVKMAGHYARSVQKTIAVDKLITDLKNTPSNRFWEMTGIPVPVVIGMNWDKSMGRIMKASDQMSKHLAVEPETAAAMKKTAMADARSDYVMVQHPSFNGMLVHKDVAPMLKMLFDTSDPGMIQRALYATSMAGKALFFTVSFFHPVALGVVAGTLALPRLTQLPRYWREIPAARAMLRNGDKAPTIEVASRAGLEFMRAPQDMDPNIVSRILNYGQNALGPVGLPLKAMRVANDWVQNLLWNEIFPTLKLASFNAELQSAVLKNPKGDPTLIAKQIAKGVNDMFGGQNWFNLANDVPGSFTRRMSQAIFSPQGRRVQQIMFLSPDWNISAARAWYEGMKSVLPGVDRKASDSMYRSYIVWSGLTYLGAANMLSNHYTGHNIWDQKDWTYVDRGDGTKIQLNKHYMEMAHLVSSPQKFLLNKLNLLPKEAIDQFFGKEWVSWDDKKGLYGPPMVEYPFGMTRPVHAAKEFIPLSVANIMRDPGAGLAGMFSFGIYGMPYKQREEEAATRAEAKQKEYQEHPEKFKRRPQSADEARERSRKRSEREQKMKFRGSDATQ